MTRRSKFFWLLVLPFGILCVGFAATIDAVAEEGKSDAAPGPLLVAELPPKPETKKYELQYKLSRGDVLRYDVSHSASIKSTIDKTTQAAQTRTDSIKVWKVTDVLPNGTIEFMNVVERVHMQNQLPDHSPTEYDSTRDAIARPGYEDAARAVGVPLSSMKITDRGKVVDRQLKVRGQGAEDDAPIVLRLPELPIGIGESWDESFDVQVKPQNGGSKTIQTRRHHRLTGVKDEIATIDVTYQVLTPIDAQVEVQIVQRLMSGKVDFDIKKGRVVGQQMEVDKRVLGFAGPTSSMQYIMKMEEKLLKNEPKTAMNPQAKSTTNKRNSARTPQTAGRQKPKQPTRSYRR